MRSTEDRLRMIIAEALGVKLNEADDPVDEPEVEKRPDPAAVQAARTRAAAEKYPEVMAAASAAAAKPVVLPPEKKRSSRGIRVEGGLSPELEGLAPTVGAEIRDLDRKLADDMRDPEYDARSEKLRARREAESNHNDPVKLLNDRITSGATLPSQVLAYVPGSVIKEMIVTPAVIDRVAATIGQESKTALAGNVVTSRVTRAEAEKFANDLRNAYSSISREKKTAAKRYDNAANQVLAGAPYSIKAALNQLIKDCDKSLTQGALVEARIYTQANALRPFMQRVEDADRKVKRITASEGGAPAGTSFVSQRNLATGKIERGEILEPASTRPRDVIVLPSSILKGFEESEVVTPDEAEIFDQTAEAQFRLTRATSYLLAGQAVTLLSLRDEVLEKLSETGTEQGDIELVQSAFDVLKEALNKSSYGKIGIETLGQASAALEKTSTGEELPTITLSDSDIDLIEDALSALEKKGKTSASLSAIASEATQGREITRADLENAIKDINRNSQIFLDKKINVQMGNLRLRIKEALDDNPGSLTFSFQPEEGSARVLTAAGLPTPAVEGNVKENEQLEAAIDIFAFNEGARQHQLQLLNTIQGMARGPSGYSGLSVARQRIESTPAIIRSLIEKALGKSVGKILQNATGDLSSKVQKIKEEYKSLATDMWSIVEGSESDPNRSDVIRAAFKASMSQMKSNTVNESVRRRIEIARMTSDSASPAKIFLTPRNSLMGALQLAIESGKKDVSVDLLTPYAFPYYGIISGDPKLEAKKGSSKRAHLEALEAKVRANNEIYTSALGRVISVGESVVIPTMLGIKRESGSLSLGVGKVTNHDRIVVPITANDVASQSEQASAALGANNAVGKSINIWSATVVFPANSWKIGAKSYNPKMSSMTDEAISKLRGFVSALDRKDLPEDIVSRIASLMDQGKQKARVEKMDPVANKDELLKEIRDRITKLGEVKSFTKADVIIALQKNEDLSTSFLDANIDLDIDGNLTIGNIAPAFLDVASANTQLINKYSWPTAVEVPITKESIELQVVPYSGGTGRYVPISSVQLNSRSSENLNSPFNINRLMTNDGRVRINYKIAGSLLGERSVSFLPNEVSASNIEELRDQKINLIKSIVAQRGSVRPLKGPVAGIQLSYPILVEVSEDDLESTKSDIDKSYEFTSSYFLYGEKENDAAKGRFNLYYSLTPEASDPYRNIAQLKIGGSDIKVGSMVYIKPMYEAMGREEIEGSANRPNPPELYGVGKVMRIYRSGTGADVREGGSTGEDNFKTLLADVQFRADQVKKGGVRGSILSPSVTVRRIGCMFLGTVSGAGVLDPTRPVARDLEANFTSTLDAKDIDRAGWQLSPEGDSTIATIPAGSFNVGGNFEIVQDNHPMKGAVGTLSGFLPASSLSNSQRNLLRSSNLRIQTSNAVIEAGGSALMGRVEDEVDALASGIVGGYTAGSSAYDAQIRQIFKHIDSEITARYLASPKGASGYASHSEPGDVIGNKMHGAGAWEEMHSKDQPVHPASETFAEMSGRTADKGPFKHVRHDKQPGLNTITGCSAILRAILEHGPEKTARAEDSYRAERRAMNPAMVQDVPGHHDSILRPYARGLHTQESVYFKDEEGRLRVGSPVGTSFRFKLSEEEGLEYTRLLRSQMRSLLDRVNLTVDSFKRMLEENSSSASASGDTIKSIEGILEDLKTNVQEPISRGIDRIESLGHKSEDASTIQNSMEAWLEKHNEIEQLSPVKTLDSSGIPAESMKQLSDLRIRVAEMSANLLGQAPIPTKQKVTIQDDGTILVKLSEGRPVSDGGARAAWRGLQRQLVDQLGSIISRSAISTQTSSDNQMVPFSQVEIKSRSASHTQVLDAMRARMDFHKDLHGSNPISWENGILLEPPLGDFIDFDGIRSAINAPTGKDDVKPGLKSTSGVLLLADDHPDLGRVVIDTSDLDASIASYVNDVKSALEGTEEGGLMKSLTELTSLLGNLALSPGMSPFFSATRDRVEKVSKDLQYLKGKTPVSFRDNREPDKAAREAADLEISIKSAMAGITRLVKGDNIEARVMPEDDASEQRVKKLRTEMMKIYGSSNERKQLADITTFPNHDIADKMIQAISRMKDAAHKRTTLTIAVPIPDIENLDEDVLNGLRMNEKIPQEFLTSVASAIKPRS